MDKRGWACCKYSLRKLLFSPRLLALIGLTVLCLDRYLAPILDMAEAEGLRVGWIGLNIFLLNDSWVSAMVAVGLLLLMFDIPQSDAAQKYLLMRAGRRAWARGQLYYILCVTALYMLAQGLILLAWIFPHMEHTLGWSGVIEQFVDGAYESYDSMLNYDPWLLRFYAPLDAFLLETLLHYICFVALVFGMGLVNGLLGNRSGFLVASVPVLIDTVITSYFPEFAYYFSPMTLTRLSCLDYGDGMLRPAAGYALLILTLLALFLGWMFVRVYGRKEVRQ